MSGAAITDLALGEIDGVAAGNQCTQATAQYGGAVAAIIGVMAVGSGPIGWATLAVAAYAGFAAVPDIEKHCQ